MIRKIWLWCKAAAAVGLLAVFLSGCAGLPVMNGDQNDAFLIEIADTAGYALGAFAADNPELKSRVEEIYKKYAAGGTSPMDALNAGISYLIDSDDLVQVLLAHKVARLVTQAGGTVGTDFNVIDLGPIINDKMLQAGKDAYLRALAIGGV